MCFFSRFHFPVFVRCRTKRYELSDKTTLAPPSTIFPKLFFHVLVSTRIRMIFSIFFSFRFFFLLLHKSREKCPFRFPSTHRFKRVNGVQWISNNTTHERTAEPQRNESDFPSSKEMKKQKNKFSFSCCDARRWREMELQMELNSKQQKEQKKKKERFFSYNHKRCLKENLSILLCSPFIAKCFFFTLLSRLFALLSFHSGDGLCVYGFFLFFSVKVCGRIAHSKSIYFLSVYKLNDFSFSRLSFHMYSLLNGFVCRWNKIQWMEKRKLAKKLSAPKARTKRRNVSRSFRTKSKASHTISKSTIHRHGTTLAYECVCVCVCARTYQHKGKLLQWQAQAYIDEKQRKWKNATESNWILVKYNRETEWNG